MVFSHSIPTFSEAERVMGSSVEARELGSGQRQREGMAAYEALTPYSGVTG